MANPSLLQSKCYMDLTKIRTANLIKKANTRGRNRFKIGQYVFLSNDNIKTVKGSRQVVLPVNRDLYKIFFSFRIINLRSSAERTVIFSELREINLEDMLEMEMDPKRFMIETGKIIRSNS